MPFHACKIVQHDMGPGVHELSQAENQEPTCSAQCSAVLPSMVTAAQRFFSSFISEHSVCTAPALQPSTTDQMQKNRMLAYIH